MSYSSARPRLLRTTALARLAPATAILGLAGTALVAPASADVYELKPIVVQTSPIHPSQEVRSAVENGFTSTRSSSAIGGSEIENFNPLNTADALRFSATGLINAPGLGNRFGGPTSIRTFGDWGAATSIDGLPAVKFSGEEGGGYSNVRIPTIAIDNISVQKGGRAVQYGNGSDGGVFQTTIKSGRGYDNHAAATIDANNANEQVLQAEFADSGEMWDVYFAGRGMWGNYDGDPANLDQQDILGAVSKIGFNPSDATRFEVLGIYNESDTTIFRGGTTNDIDSDMTYLAATVDHAFSANTSARAGYLYSDTQSLWPARSRDRSIVIGTAFADLYHTQPIAEGIGYAGSIGVEYKDTNMLRDDIWDNTFRDWAVKSTNTVTFNDNLSLTAGLRYTWFDNDIVYNGVTQADNLQTDSLFSWEAGAAYSIFDETRLRASVASGYNRFYEKYGNFGTDALNPSGAQDEIVESRTYEVGINQGWGWGFLDVAYYEIKQENVPRRDTGGALQNVTVEQSGLEAEVFADITDDLTASVGLTHLFELEATRDDGTFAYGNIFFGSNGVNVPENLVNLRVDYRLSDRFSVWSAALYGDGYVQTDATGTDAEHRDYERIDVGAAWQMGDHLAFRIRGENLTDEKDFGTTLEGATVNTTGLLGRVFWFGFDVTL